MSHRTRSNRPAYFDEYRAAFDRRIREIADDTPAPKHLYVAPVDPQPGDVVYYMGEMDWPDRLWRAGEYPHAAPRPRTDWRDGTDEGWGE